MVIYIQDVFAPFKFLSCYILVGNSDILTHSSSLILEGGTSGRPGRSSKLEAKRCCYSRTRRVKFGRLATGKEQRQSWYLHVCFISCKLRLLPRNVTIMTHSSEDETTDSWAIQFTLFLQQAWKTFWYIDIKHSNHIFVTVNTSRTSNNNMPVFCWVSVAETLSRNVQPAFLFLSKEDQALWISEK